MNEPINRIEVRLFTSATFSKTSNVILFLISWKILWQISTSSSISSMSYLSLGRFPFALSLPSTPSAPFIFFTFIWGPSVLQQYISQCADSSWLFFLFEPCTLLGDEEALLLSSPEVCSTKSPSELSTRVTLDVTDRRVSLSRMLAPTPRAADAIGFWRFEEFPWKSSFRETTTDLSVLREKSSLSE